MAYTCRDCGSKVKALTKKNKNSCPRCGSMYLLPEKIIIKTKKREFKVTVSDRFLSLLFGGFAGLITFFIWGILIMMKGGGSSGKAAVGTFYYGAQFSLYFAVAVGLFGFFLGSDKLMKLLGILWGTDKEFHQNVEESVNDFLFNIPMWFAYSFWGIVLVGTYGYIMMLFL